MLIVSLTHDYKFYTVLHPFNDVADNKRAESAEVKCESERGWDCSQTKIKVVDLWFQGNLAFRLT